MAIRYAIVSCELGRVLVAGSERGIRAVFLADTNEELTTALATEFPGEALMPDDGQVGKWLPELMRQIMEREASMPVPLDVKATAFQRQIWAELQQIPAGTTRTYGQIAAAIGRPTAARAVARACATNPVSVLIPCHRVVGTNGKLTGYRWGLKRKEMLLDREKHQQAGSLEGHPSTAKSHSIRRRATDFHLVAKSANSE